MSMVYPLLIRRRSFALGTAASLVGLPVLAQAAPVKVRFQCDWRFEAGTLPYVLALRKGYFAQEGLDVALNVGSGASATVTRLASGNFDMGTGDMSSLAEFAANNGQVPCKAVMLMYESTPAAVFSLRKTGIAKPSDLRGRKLGAPVNDAARRIFPIFAAANGLDAKDVEWLSMDPAIRETMLARGQIEAISGYMASGWVSLQRQGVAPEDIRVMKFADYGVKLPGNAILATPAFLRSQPQAVAGFLRAVTRGLRDAVTDRAAAIAVLKEHEPLVDAKVEALRLNVILDGEIGTPAVKRNGIGDIDLKGYQQGIESLAKVLAFKSVSDAASLVDASLLPARAQRQVFAA
jgi:NitT/TauT family transport system substrate-binding protein